MKSFILTLLFIMYYSVIVNAQIRYDPDFDLPRDRPVNFDRTLNYERIVAGIQAENSTITYVAVMNVDLIQRANSNEATLLDLPFVSAELLINPDNLFAKSRVASGYEAKVYLYKTRDGRNFDINKLKLHLKNSAGETKQVTLQNVHIISRLECLIITGDASAGGDDMSVSIRIIGFEPELM